MCTKVQTSIYFIFIENTSGKIYKKLLTVMPLQKETKGSREIETVMTEQFIFYRTLFGIWACIYLFKIIH